jgi:tRNA A-37 threonylcarbamoyl transferase component Bud32
MDTALPTRYSDFTPLLGLPCIALFCLVLLFCILFTVWFFSRLAVRGRAKVGEQQRNCPTCGAPLAADAPHGLCPKCLFGQGLRSDAGKFVLAGDKPEDRTTPPKPPGAATAPYPGTFAAPSPAELAPHFPQLEFLELLGQGGMGAVYKVRQPNLDRFVALKILPPGRDAAFAERFTREARALAKLSHPDIVGVHDFGQAGDFYYFIMEYVDGVNLRQTLNTGKLTPTQALHIVPQICAALQYAHEEGIVHRDIKPENILLDKKGRVKIADFGLAKVLDRDSLSFQLTATHQVMGTPHYMAPEQMERPLEVDHRADIYSLGVVFYEMLTGELPLGRFAPPSQKGGVDVRLDEVVLRALEKEPDRRYQQVSEVKTEVEAISNTGMKAAVASFERAQELQKLSMSKRPAVPQLLKTREQQVQGPAIGLLVAGFLHITAVLLTLPVWAMVQRSFWELERDPGPKMLIVNFYLPLGLLLGGFLIVSALRMMWLKSYPLVMIAGILAMAPWSIAWPLALPLGFWALLVLRRPEVAAAFEPGADKPTSRLL